ncbi:MAG: anti-sigma factor [Rhodobacteraceae bacterium]|nr:anti-sigma factor [Paracoccaceae bacterium]
MTRSTLSEEMIQRAIDGQLSAQEQVSLEQHLEAHPKDAERIAQMQRQSDLIRSAIPEPSVAHLRQLRERADRTAAPSLRVAASAAIFVLGLGAGYALHSGGGNVPSDMAQFAQAAKNAHALYVSEVLHPVEVAASQKDHLQAWLSNRLGAAIIAPQLGESGYRLMGGRLLPSGAQASALFMYENAQGDRLSLIATHGGGQDKQSFRYKEEDGYLTVFWQDGPWRYSLVGARPRETMDQIAREVHGQLI